MAGPLTDENGMIAGTVADVAAPAEWAMKAAVSAFDQPLPTDSIMLSVASAIEAAANAATERAAQIAETRQAWPSSFTHHAVAVVIAFAIRKGEKHG